MSKQAVLRRYGPLLEISQDGREPLPMNVTDQLACEMVYTKSVRIQPTRGRWTGERTRYESSEHRLYRYDSRKRLICGAGYVDRVYTRLRKQGFAVRYVDETQYASGPDAMEPDWEGMAEGFSFRPRQEEIVGVIARRVEKRLGGVIQVPPGVGKSYLLRALSLLYPKARIAVTAPDIDNCKKTYAHLLQAFPGVGFVGDGRKEKCRVTVYTAASLHHLEDSDRADLVFVDEAHKYMADKTAEVLVKVAPSALKFGFTATPEGRPDGCDARIEPILGPVIYRMSWPEAIDLGLVVPIEVVWVPVRLDHNPVRGIEDFTRRRRLGIWRNEGRNQVIAGMARMFDEEEQVLIMTNTVEHALQLRKLLPEYSLVHGPIDSDKFRKFESQGLTENFTPIDATRREEMRQEFAAGTLKKVIATDVWSTGVSFDALQVLIRADARSSKILDEQIPGRVSRTHVAGGKQSGLLIDFRDDFDPSFFAASRKRSRSYQEKGWKELTLS